MTLSLIDLAVGDPTPDASGEPATVSLAEAVEIAEAAQAAGVTALRLLDGAPGRHHLDPGVVASYLAGTVPGLGYVVDVPTSHHAPYNLARRIQSLDRATAGRVGLALQPGDGDEVSDAAAPDPSATGREERWAEYASLLTLLWDSFPREALVGDQAAAIVVEESLLRPPAHEGRFYRVAGPLDGPASEQGRPVLVAAWPGSVDWDAVAASSDVVVVGQDQAAGADVALTAALERAGRARRDVALLGRRVVEPPEVGTARALADELAAWTDRHRLDGLDLVPTGGAAGVLATLHALVPALAPVSGPTLRGALRLPESVAR